MTPSPLPNTKPFHHPRGNPLGRCVRPPPRAFHFLSLRSCPLQGPRRSRSHSLPATADVPNRGVWHVSSRHAPTRCGGTASGSSLICGWTLGCLSLRLPWPTPSFWAVGDMSAFASGHRPRRDRQGHGAVARSACWAAACCGPRPARCVDRKPASRLTPTRPRLLSPAGSVQPWSKVPSWCRLWVAGHMPVSGSVLSFWVKVSECIPEKRRTPTRTGRDHAGSRLVVPRAEGTQEAG